MKAAKYLIFVAIFASASASYASDSFVSHYEPLHGISLRAGEALATDEKERAWAKSANLSFEALGQRFDLDLEANDRVLEALPSAAAFDGIAVYRGRLSDNPDSWARIVILDGIPRGLVWDGSAMYAIEAPGDSVVDISEPVIFRLSDLNIVPGTMTCGAASVSGNAAKIYESLKADWSAAASQAAGATSEITMGALGDAQFTSAQGGEAEAVAAITARFNNVDGYFSEQVGIQIRVELVETYDNSTDPFDDTLDSNALLDQVSELRLQTPALRSRGLTHLYTGRDISDTTVGVAWRGGLCDNYFSTGLSEGRRGTTTDSLITAHEIGHNFGAQHDGEAGTPCESEPQTYIMAPRVNNSRQFSACSIAVMQEELAGARCVSALPSVDVGIGRASEPGNVLLGARTAINYTVTANGSLDVADVVADFTLPSVVSLESVTTTSGNCISGGGTVSCELGNITGLSSETVTLTVTPVAVGTGTLNASVTTSGSDERSSNNQDSLTLTIDPAVDLVVNAPRRRRRLSTPART